MANYGPADITIEYDNSGGTLVDISAHVLTINDVDVENITEEIYYDSNYASGDPVNIFPEVYWGVGRPRTAGLRFSYDF